MHELSLCLETIETLEREAVTQRFNKVTQLWLEIGALSCIEVDAITFGFDAAARGTLAEGCQLHIDTIPGQAQCLDCAKVVSLGKRGDCCPHCSSYKLHVLTGNSMRIKEMEVS